MTFREECPSDNWSFAADEMIALEVDGPHHFTANTLKPLGEMLARQRLLEARGWTVISVPFYVWSNKTPEYRQSYLQEVPSRHEQSNVPLPQILLRCQVDSPGETWYLPVGHCR